MRRIIRYMVVITVCLLAKHSLAQSVVSQVENFLFSQSQQLNLTLSDLQFEVLSEHTSSISGVHHLYFIQTANGLPISGTESSVHFVKNKPIASHLKFIGNSEAKLTSDVIPSITANRAVALAIEDHGYSMVEPISVIKRKDEINRETILSKVSVFKGNISAKLSYHLTGPEQIDLVWEFLLKETDDSHYWNLKINAQTGQVISKEDIVVSCNYESAKNRESVINDFNFNPYPPVDYHENEPGGVRCSECYEVFKLPVENPYYGERSVVVQPADLVASPYGWHDTDGNPGYEYDTTIGNNIAANTAGGYSPHVGSALDFTGFPFDTNSQPSNRSVDAVLTNTFYVLNSVHDILYHYGFDEAAGNFQQNNYGNPGEDGDHVKAFIHNRNRCGSIFIPAVDGTSPHIIYGICENRDAATDSDVLIHEYIHGLTTRLVHPRSGFQCLRNIENLAEGLSDWYSKVITIKEGQQGSDAIGFGNYITGEGPDGIGTNIYHYSTDMNINPFTYDDVRIYQTPHLMGGIWATMLWEMTWGLIDEFGFDPNIYNFTGTSSDAGNIRALAIVTEALKLMPCEPGFVDGRDAVFLANRSIYGGKSECILWEAFGKRGLGELAFQGSSQNVEDGYSSFEIPAKTAIFNFPENELCLTSEVSTDRGRGYPIGGIYSGPGVTDNGDGRTYTFDPAEAGIGEHTIIYEVMDSRCSIRSSASDVVMIVEDEIAPTISCPVQFESIYADADVMSLLDYTPQLSAQDNCTGLVTIEQDPPPGTIITTGLTILTFTAVDQAGNDAFCEVPLFVFTESELKNGPPLLDMYPNPTRGQVTIRLRRPVDLISAKIYDLHGRLVKTYDLSHVINQTILNTESLSTGMYFVLIELENTIITKELLME